MDHIGRTIAIVGKIVQWVAVETLAGTVYYIPNI